MDSRGFRFTDDVAFREIGGEYHFLTSDNVYHSVRDPVGALILGIVEKRPGVTTHELAKAVRAEFEVGADQAEADVAEFLDGLVARRILEDAGRSS
jgi:hypothetical protein